MEVHCVGHASISIECQNPKILCDPRLVGKAFNNDWALLSPTNPTAFSTVDYIWTSHEHPYHLSFPSLKGIPHSDKSRFTGAFRGHSVADDWYHGHSQISDLLSGSVPLGTTLEITP